VRRAACGARKLQIVACFAARHAPRKRSLAVASGRLRGAYSLFANARAAVAHPSKMLARAQVVVDDASDAEDDAVVAPREAWQSDRPLPDIDVRTHNPKTGAVRSDEAIATDRQRLGQRAVRDERARLAKQLPHQKKGHGVLGGAHEHYEGWTANEDEELIRILPLNKIRPSWAEVTYALSQATGKARSAKSVRCRWNRIRTGRLRSRLPDDDPMRSKKRCRVCGMLKRGHLCPGPPGKPKLVDQMLIEVHQAMAAKGLSTDSSEDDDESAQA